MMSVCGRCGSTYLGGASFCPIDGERLASGDRDPLIGTIVDRYRVLDILGVGGMARVYRAEHVHLAQPIALKVLLGDVGSDRRCADRFLREARAAAQIRHVNVVEVRDFGVTASGLSFMAMELLEGRTLAQHCIGRRLVRDEIVRIARQTALGLAAAHRLGFVHRDLTPKNLMIGSSLQVKILDFGLVRLVEPADSRLTLLGQVLGSPAYMAPEQIVDGPIDARTDLYSLGVILYELLYGRRPFDGDRAEDRSALGRLVQSMTAKLPSERPSSAEAVVEALDALDSRRVIETAIAPREAPAPIEVEIDPAVAAMVARARPVWPRRLLVLGLAVTVAAAAYPHVEDAAASFAGWSVQATELAEAPTLVDAASSAAANTDAAAATPVAARSAKARAVAAEPRKNKARPTAPKSKLLPRLPSKKSKAQSEVESFPGEVEADPDEPPETPPIASSPPSEPAEAQALTSTPSADLRQVPTASSAM